MRHGETTFNKEHLIGGIIDTPLTKKGEDQARRAAATLHDHNFSYIAVSPLQRALKTAQLALPHAALNIHEDLKERNWGDLEGRPTEELTNRFGCPSHGEHWDEFCRRVLLTVNGLLTRHDKLLIVAHSGIYRVLCAAIGEDPEAPQIANASVWCFSPEKHPEQPQNPPNGGFINRRYVVKILKHNHFT